MTLRDNIRRALRTPCNTDILRHFIAPADPATRHRGQCRTTYGRLQDVLLELRSGKPVNCRRLAKLFGVTEKSAYRDIKFLRDEGFGISWDAQANTYRLADCSNHPWLQLKESK